MARFITAACIDVSKTMIEVAVWPEEAPPLQVSLDAPDCWDSLAAWLTQHDVKRVGLEASGGYAVAVIDALTVKH